MSGANPKSRAPSSKVALSKATALRMYVDYEAGLSLAQVAEKHGVSRYQVFSAFRRNGLKRRKPGCGRKRISLEAVRTMHGDYMKPMSLAAVGRKYKRHRGSVRELFVSRGLEVRPCDFEPVRLPNGCIAPAKPLTKAEIDALIASATKLAVPPALKREWRQWPMQRRATFIKRLRAKLKSRVDRPNQPFSSNVEPFDYSSAYAREIIARKNAGKNSRECGCKINVGSQGVIYRGELYFWVSNTGYAKGVKWTPENGRPILSRVIWEEHNERKIPDQGVIRFADGNPNNFAPENLILRTMNDLCREAQANYLSKRSRELTALLLQRSQQKEEGHGLIEALNNRKAA